MKKLQVVKLIAILIFILIVIKRKTSQTYWEIESIYYRACRITGSQPDTEAYKDLDYKDAIIILKRLIVKTISSI